MHQTSGDEFAAIVLYAGLTAFIMWTVWQRIHAPQKNHRRLVALEASSKMSVVRVYRGHEARASSDFARDSDDMAKAGFYATSQVWLAGSYGCGAFTIALFLCFALVGFPILIYLLVVKPKGHLAVTYMRQYQINSVDNFSDAAWRAI